MMCDGITINKKHSYNDFGLCIKTRDVGLPEKKSIRQTVPYMNGYYDFSALNGAPAWGERTVTYVFDVLAESPQALESYATRVFDWLCNVHDEDIFDDTMPDFHFHGSYNGYSLTWDEGGEHLELSVEFVCYPFKIANDPVTVYMQAGEYTVRNDGMNVSPIVISDEDAAVQVGSIVTSVPALEEVTLEVDLVRGDNTVIVTGEGTVEFSYYREVI